MTTCGNRGIVGEQASKQCVTCERVPLTLYTFSGGIIARVRLGCLCSSIIVYSDSEESAAIAPGARARVIKRA
jgi:hypothetical protein